MLTINCSGSPSEIGFEHGSKAALQIKSSIEYYTGYFQTKSKLHWPKVCDMAMRWAPHIHERFPRLEAELQGVAKGAGVKYEEILVLNLRVEIIFGLFSDGCTSMSWKTDDTSFLAQNWDWMEEQKKNVVLLNIKQDGKPNISMLTESGIIGKIGLNSAGVGVCANGIRVAGCDYTRTPIHFCLRLILESSTMKEAIAVVEEHGCACAAHMLVADPTGSVGLEVTAKTFIELPMDAKGRVFHSNHLLEEHEGAVDTVWIEDSLSRIKRIRRVADEMAGPPDEEKISGLFADEDNYPYSICRAQEGKSDGATLFNIVMNLTERTALVKLGRPIAPDEVFTLRPYRNGS